MSETKNKIRAMIDEEASQERKDKLKSKRKKKTSKHKTTMPRVEININDEQKKMFRGFSVVAAIFILALALFYTASITDQSADEAFLEQTKKQANDKLAIVTQQINSRLKPKLDKFQKILEQSNYQTQFNNLAWQSTYKVELEAYLGNQAKVNIISAQYSETLILDKLKMGYGMLSLLTEINASKNNIRLEIHHLANQEGRMYWVKKVIYRNKKTKETTLLGYIIVYLPQSYINKLAGNLPSQDGYIEVVQRFGSQNSILVKQGDIAKKSLPLMVSQKITHSQWYIQFWPKAQQDTAPLSLLWPTFALLLGASLALVIAIIMLIIIVKNYKTAHKISIEAEIEQQKHQTKKESKRAAPEKTQVINTPNSNSAEANSIYQSESGISVDESDDGETEYLREITGKIFRAYDIRGVVGDYINAEMFKLIAYAIAKEMTEQDQSQISIAYDGRNSSPELVKSLTEGLLESGINVTDIGMVSSPILYYSAITQTAGNGIIVTASHNPGDHNGMKIMLLGHSYSEVRLQKLREKVILGEQVSGSSSGILSTFNALEDYMSKISGNVILARPMKIVVDCGNGVTGKFAGEFFKQLGCMIEVINEEVDGNFPGHAPDPSRPENLSQLIEKVKDNKAELGIAFDGDGDRIGLVSSAGEIIWPDRILMLLAKDILSRNKDAMILYDVKSTAKLDGYIQNLCGTSQMCQSGHSFMKSKLLETGALLAGEMSGHIFIKERWFGFDDALFVAARVLEILSIDLRKSRQVFAELPDSLNTPEILVASNNAPEIINQLKTNLSVFNDAKVIDIDGLRVEYPDGWGLIRSSNTSDNLTLRFEGDNEEALQRIANKFKMATLAVDASLEFPF